MEGSRKTGYGLLLGDIDASPVLGVAEGWSTGVSVHMAMAGMPVLITFGCTNLAAAKNFAKPGQKVWFFADRDTAGINAAHAAAALFDPIALVVQPSLKDFNEDYMAGIGQTPYAQRRQDLAKLMKGA